MNRFLLLAICLVGIGDCEPNNGKPPVAAPTEQLEVKPEPTNAEPTELEQPEQEPTDLEAKRSKLASRIGDYEKSLKDSEEAFQQLVAPGGRLRQGFIPPEIRWNQERANAVVLKNKFALLWMQKQIVDLDYQMVPKEMVTTQRLPRVRYLRSYAKSIEKEIGAAKLWLESAKVSELDDVVKSLQETIANWEKEDLLVQQQLTEMEDTVLLLIRQPDEPAAK